MFDDVLSLEVIRLVIMEEMRVLQEHGFDQLPLFLGQIIQLSLNKFDIALDSFLFSAVSSVNSIWPDSLRLLCPHSIADSPGYDNDSTVGHGQGFTGEMC